ncbi:hypothetical protein F5B18DRAFT_512801 [Nemania serpens]|nr:hypothetical protein F5B18DRAFT_512801 [Nemania serpens]
MNFIRRSVLGRRGSQDGSDLERQRPTEVEEQTQSSPRTFAFFRPSLPSLFAGRLSLGPQIHSARAEDSEHDDRPKSPGPDRLHVSRLQHIPSQQLPGDGTQDGESPSQPSRVHTRTQRFPILARPLAARTNAGESERHVRRSTFSGSRPAELHLADLVESRRRQQRATERRANSGSSRRRQQKEPPKRFLFCFPWVKSRRARSLILRCFVSGILLISILTVYLALSVTKSINTSEFSILLIILILLATIIFCHGLILLCMLLVRSRNRRDTSGNDVHGGKYGHPGYAIPREPIRVVLARDEEAAGIESEAAKLKPPAYGLWRESVRVDPDRIYWQRAEVPPSASSTNSDSDSDGRDSPRTGQRRPPSYASDDGIDYVVDVRPRSIAPPPSSVYSRTSTMESPMVSNMTDVPPLPYSTVMEPPRSLVVGRPGNWSMI